MSSRGAARRIETRHRPNPAENHAMRVRTGHQIDRMAKQGAAIARVLTAFSGRAR